MGLNFGDFTGFTFNGTHSSTLNLVRVSDSDRYQEDLVPDMDNTASDVPGGDGQYFFGSKFKEREIPCSMAYDKITETNRRQIKRWLGDKQIHELIFDEKPYIKYYARVNKSITTKDLCFMENGSRVYKGEFEISFMIYSVYGLQVSKDSSYFNEYENQSEWLESSGLISFDYDGLGAINKIDTFVKKDNKVYNINLYNPGDKETGFKFLFKKLAINQIQALTLKSCDDTLSQWINPLVNTGYFASIRDNNDFTLIYNNIQYHAYTKSTIDNPNYDIYIDNFPTTGLVISSDPLLASSINFIVPTSSPISIRLRIDDDHDFTLTFPAPPIAKFAEWGEKEKAGFLSCYIEIDTNNKTIVYMETLDGNRIGMAGLINNGSLFKIPCNISTEEYSIMSITPSTPTMAELVDITKFGIEYNYLYL